MSAIYGVFQRNGQPVTPHLLQPMVQAMRHWGRDGHSCWQGGSIGFGQLLCQQTVEAREERVITDHPAYPHLAITAAARIDNRADVLSRLSIPRLQWDAMSDSELILHSYARWGQATPAELLGAYTFAIWDHRQQHLFCARDHMGFYPFYYHQTAERFLFASTIPGVLAAPDVPYRIHEQRLFASRSAGSRDLKEHTPLEDVSKLPPATTLLVMPEQMQRRSYWLPSAAPSLPTMRLDEYAEGLRTHLERAVTAASRTHLPIAAHLSGGLDSSSVAVLAHRQLRQQGGGLAATYSWSPPPKPADYPLQDERAFVEAICAQEGLICHYVEVTAADIAQLGRRNPVTEPNNTLQYESVVCRQAAAVGIAVMLSGWGGDEVVTFNGDGLLAELLLKGRWPLLWGELHHRSRQQGTSLFATFKAQVLGPFLPPWVYTALARRPMLDARSDLTVQQRKTLRQHLDRIRPTVGVRRTQLRQLDNAHITSRIEAWADYAAAYGIEHRYPLLDRRLLDYCLGLPPTLTLHQGWKRYLFRYAVRDLLPESVTWRIGKRDEAFLRTFADRQRASSAVLAGV